MTALDRIVQILTILAVLILSLGHMGTDEEIEKLQKQDARTTALIADQIDVMGDQADLFTRMTDNLEIVEEQYNQILNNQQEAQNG